VEATGFDLDIRLARPAAALDRLTGPLGTRLRRRRRAVIRAAAAHGISNLRVFGSVARGTDRPGSDIDLLADLPPGMGLIALERARHELEEILGTRVDLIPTSDLKPDLATEVLAEAVRL
jgi:predicted nucleotidyltransferase